MKIKQKSNTIIVMVITVLAIAVATMSVSIVRNLSSEDESIPDTVVTDGPTTAAQSTTQAAEPTSYAPVTASPTTVVPSSAQANVMTTVPAPSQAQQNVPGTPEEICALYNKAVNELKNSKGYVDIHKTEHINLEITDFSLPAPMDAVNSVVKNIVPDTDAEYSFSNGVITDGTSQTLSASVPPFAGSANVTADDIIEATAIKKDEGYLITISILPEASDYDGTSTIPAVHLLKVGNPVDFSSMNMGPLSISKARMNYHDVTVSAQLDSQGRVTVLSSIIPVSVTSTGEMSVFTADIAMNIKVDTTYYVTYR